MSEYQLPMDVKATKLQGVLVLKPHRFTDERGFFAESYVERLFEEVGVAAKFVQDNQSFSTRQGTIRGLHFQLPPATQTKLVRVSRGCIYDVVVDLRRGSPTYGQWVSERLSAAGGEQIYVPWGFAHGFCTLEPNTEVIYKVDSYYAPLHDSGIIWNDPTLNIPWPVAPEAAIVSAKDSKLGTFSDFVSPFQYERVVNA
jgi:dTDP-4-dehydrorhamnose 3,5-epimerase